MLHHVDTDKKLTIDFRYSWWWNVGFFMACFK